MLTDETMTRLEKGVPPFKQKYEKCELYMNYLSGNNNNKKMNN